MTANAIGRHLCAGFASLVVWLYLAFIFLVIVTQVPQYPPRGIWPLWASGTLAVPAAIFTWRVVLRGPQAGIVDARTHALLLIGLGVFWLLLFVALFVIRTPVSKDAYDSGFLAYFIVGPVPIVAALPFAIKERQFRRGSPHLYWPAVLLALSPVLVFCVQHFL